MKFLIAIIAALILASFSLCWADAGWLDDDWDCWNEDEKTEQVIEEHFNDALLPEDWTAIGVNWESGGIDGYKFLQIFGGNSLTTGLLFPPTSTFQRIDHCENSDCTENISLSFQYVLISNENIKFQVELGHSLSATGDWSDATPIQWATIWEMGAENEDFYKRIPWQAIKIKKEIDFHNYNLKHVRLFLIFQIQSIREFRMYFDNVNLKYEALIRHCEPVDEEGNGQGNGEDDDQGDDSIEDNDGDKNSDNDGAQDGDDHFIGCSVIPNNQTTHIGLTALMLAIGIGAMFWQRR
jgi:hypothetical protein